MSDQGGLSDTDTVVIRAGNTPPAVTIDTPAPTDRWKVGDPIGFSGHATDAQQGTLPAASLSWSLVMRHCTGTTGCHSHQIQDYPGVAGGSFNAPDHEFPSYLELTVTATDAGGLSDTETLRLDPQTVNLTLASQPAGASLTLQQRVGRRADGPRGDRAVAELDRRHVAADDRAARTTCSSPGPTAGRRATT